MTFADLCARNIELDYFFPITGAFRVALTNLKSRICLHITAPQFRKSLHERTQKLALGGIVVALP